MSPGSIAPTSSTRSRDACGGGERRELRAERAGSADAEVQVRIAGEGVEQHEEALLGDEPAEEAHGDAGDGAASARRSARPAHPGSRHPPPAGTAPGRPPAGSPARAPRTPSPRRCAPPRRCTPTPQRPCAAPTARTSGTAPGTACGGSARCTARRAGGAAAGAARAAAAPRRSRARTAPRAGRDVPPLAERAPDRPRVVDEQRGVAAERRAPSPARPRAARARPRPRPRATRAEISATSTPSSVSARSRPRHSSTTALWRTGVDGADACRHRRHPRAGSGECPEAVLHLDHTTVAAGRVRAAADAAGGRSVGAVVMLAPTADEGLGVYETLPADVPRRVVGVPQPAGVSWAASGLQVLAGIRSSRRPWPRQAAGLPRCDSSTPTRRERPLRRPRRALLARAVRRARSRHDRPRRARPHRPLPHDEGHPAAGRRDHQRHPPAARLGPSVPQAPTRS